MKYFLFVLLFLLPASAFGQEFPPILTIPPGNDNIVVVKKGEPVPFTGQLLDGPTALRWANWLEQYRTRLKLDVQFQKQFDAAELKAVNTQLDAERKKYLEVTKLYETKISELEKKLEKPVPWYKTSEFGFSMGVLVSLVVVVSGAALISAIPHQ